MPIILAMMKAHLVCMKQSTIPLKQLHLKKWRKKEKILHLREHIKELPEQHQKILMLYYMEELRLSEIAQVFGLSEGRISQILSFYSFTTCPFSNYHLNNPIISCSSLLV